MVFLPRRVALGGSDQAKLEELISLAYTEFGRAATAQAILVRIQETDFSLWERWQDATPIDGSRERFIRSRRPPPAVDLRPVGSEPVPAPLDDLPPLPSWFSVPPEVPEAALPRVWLIGEGQREEMQPWTTKFRKKDLKDRLAGADPSRTRTPGSPSLLLYLVSGGVLFRLAVRINGESVVYRNAFYIGGGDQGPPPSVTGIAGPLALEWTPPAGSHDHIVAKGADTPSSSDWPYEVSFDLADDDLGTKHFVVRGRVYWEEGRGWVRVTAEDWGSTDIY